MIKDVFIYLFVLSILDADALFAAAVAAAVAAVILAAIPAAGIASVVAV